jgi:hypothetical protein
MSTQHPKAVEAAERARKAKHAKTAEHAHVESAVKGYSLKFVHIRPELPGHTSVTVAYRRSGRNELEVAVATRHPRDAFCKFEGRKAAVNHYLRGRYIHLHCPDGRSPAAFLQKVFLPATIRKR